MNLKRALLCFFLISSTVSFSQETTISFLALGDSYTIGTSERPENNWPNQLTKILNKKGYKTEAKIVAKAGWTTENILSEIKKENLKPNYDLVSLLIGVNNQYRGMEFESFKKDFILLLDKSLLLARNDGTKAIVLSIPDWSVTPFARFKDKVRIVEELKAYNSFIKLETEKRGMTYVEITKSSRNAAVSPSLLASDSLHPSKKMYKIWAKKISKKVLKDFN
ncbi:SGNH/GDSL hydrolase family protein [uncultured Croceitalea sp.]|uniref:SGNH/GDSL hydrolase family protein n=1 Tax=uncultured Croceitalea sp. TaxID=1798908 RepID=UPI003305E200